MRAIKAVLITAGNLKIKSPNDNEEKLVLRAINDVNLPKVKFLHLIVCNKFINDFVQFIYEDIALFFEITSDIFHNVVIETNDYEVLIRYLKKNVLELKLEYNDWYIERIIQVKN
jgi:dynein heavy chain